MYASNWLTLIGEQEAQLGWVLTKETTIDQNNFPFTFTGDLYSQTLTVSWDVNAWNLSTNGYINAKAIYLNIVNVGGSYTVQPDESTIAVSNGGSFVIITLPDALEEVNRIITIKRYDSSSTGNIRVTSASWLVQDVVTFSFVANTTLIGASEQRATFQSDGSNWHIISK